MPAFGPADLERYRPYLTFLARAQVSPGRRDPLDLSGVVQQTFLEAHQTLGQFRGQGPAQLAGWLRQILARNLADQLRRLGAAKRDAGRARSLEDALAQSSARLADLLATDRSSPAQHAEREERALHLAAAMTALPEAQREALVLQYWHGLSLAEIAARLGRTPAAAAGLLKRGLRQLRADMNAGGDQSGDGSPSPGPGGAHE